MWSSLTLTQLFHVCDWFIVMYTEHYFWYYIFQENIAHYARYGNKAQFGTFILYGFIQQAW